MGGSYTVSGDSVRFVPFVTRMACPDLPKEQAFLAALDSATTLKLTGERLELFGPQRQVVARFESVYLR